MVNPGTYSPSREDLHQELIKQVINKVKLEKKSKVSLEIVKMRPGIRTTKWHDSGFSCVYSAALYQRMGIRKPQRVALR